jgi:hypothetical protein
MNARSSPEKDIRIIKNNTDNNKDLTIQGILCMTSSNEISFKAL